MKKKNMKKIMKTIAYKDLTTKIVHLIINVPNLTTKTKKMKMTM